MIIKLLSLLLLVGCSSPEYKYKLGDIVAVKPDTEAYAYIVSNNLRNRFVVMEKGSVFCSDCYKITLGGYRSYYSPTVKEEDIAGEINETNNRR